MVSKSIPSSEEQFVTTGEAARICSVTPNTILRWINEGKLVAEKTSGGHHRISRSELTSVMSPTYPRGQSDSTARDFEYCWEFHSSSGTVEERCLQCIVYRSRSGRCFELAKMAGHSQFYCTSSCEDCDYYHEVRSKSPSMLVVTSQAGLGDELDSIAGINAESIRFAADEYSCCLQVDAFRPDYVVIDCCLGSERCLALARNLAKDRRIPYARIILAGNPDNLGGECDAVAFAFVKRPLSARVIAELMTSI